MVALVSCYDGRTPHMIASPVGQIPSHPIPSPSLPKNERRKPVHLFFPSIRCWILGSGSGPYCMISILLHLSHSNLPRPVSSPRNTWRQDSLPPSHQRRMLPSVQRLTRPGREDDLWVDVSPSGRNLGHTLARRMNSREEREKGKVKRRPSPPFASQNERLHNFPRPSRAFRPEPDSSSPR